MWYAVWRISNKFRSDKGNVGGFILDDDEETPKSWDSLEEAKESMQGHILESVVEFIEL